MKHFYDQMIASATKITLEALDRELSAPQFYERVFNGSKITTPKLNLDRTQVQIKKEEISYKNAPPGISFSMSGNTTVEYVLYNIPITGNMDIFASLVKPYIDRQRTYVDRNTLFYKEYSNMVITGNDDLINEIKNRVIDLTTQINNSLKQHEDELIQFYEITLKPTINEIIKSEISKRNLSSESESKLNPFV